MQMIDEAEERGDLEQLVGTHNLKVLTGMIDGEVALLSITSD